MYKISKAMYLIYILQMLVFTFLWLQLKLKLQARPWCIMPAFLYIIVYICTFKSPLIS